MPREYNKLVRDHIPYIIRSHGDNCDVVILNYEEYRRALCDKVLEEAHEVANADVQHLAIEIADLYEVLDALLDSYSLSPAEVQALQERKRNECGGFTQRIFLQRTYTKDNLSAQQ